MGLLKTIELESGLIVQNAYCKIIVISGNSEEMTLYLSTYVDRDASIEEKPYLRQTAFSFVPSLLDGADNFIKQGYEHLKTLPEFTNAVDVLE